MKRLTLSRTDRKIAGVCGGVGEYFEIDSTLVRIGLVLLCLITAILPVVIGYLVCMLIIPDDNDAAPPPDSSA